MKKIQRHGNTLWIERPYIVKMAILPKAIYRFNAIPITTPTSFFKEIEQKHHQICMEPQKTLNSQKTPEKNESWSIKLLDFKLYYKATVIRTEWYLVGKQTHRPMEQNWKPRSKHTHIQANNFWQNSQKHTMEKESLLNKWCWVSWKDICKKKKLD